MPCFVMTSILGVLLAAVLLCQYIVPLNVSPIVKISLGLLFALCSVSPVLIPVSEKMIEGKAYVFYYHSALFLFITIVILFNYTVIADMTIIIGHFLKADLVPALNNRGFINKINAACFFAAAISSCYALYEGTRIPKIKTTFITDKKITKEYKIAVLSDIHLNRVVNPTKIAGIVSETNRLSPDMTVLVGDIIDDDPKNIEKHLQILKKLHAKDDILFVPGNHETYRGYARSVKIIKEIGFTVLENNGIKTKSNIYIGGIPDPGRFRASNIISDPGRAFAASSDNNYRILLSHTPKDFSGVAFDLEIAGHTHGGQIMPFHFFAKMYNKYLAGLYEISEGKNIYVSRGAGQWGPQMRFMAPAEIAELIFKPER